jgi:multidrug efflux pump subunit AcrB
MAGLAVLVIGLFSLDRLGVDLLPQIVYPEITVRVTDSGVPPKIMEDQVTRQLEEQLAITEDAIGVQSRSSQGRSSVDLSFAFGKSIDIALRDASSRLDRAKRFLPDSIDPPVIFKRDPSQIPVMEYVVSSRLVEPTALRSWVDYVFSKWLLNLPGVASVEVGGAPFREILILPDQQRLAGHGLKLDDLVSALQRGNLETAGGALRMAENEISSRTAGRFVSIEEVARLPITRTDDSTVVYLHDIAQVVDGHQDEKLRIRLNKTPGVKVSIQKQPQANTVAVVDAVRAQVEWLNEQALIPKDIEVARVADQSVYIRHALANASTAAGTGALLAMLVVYLFLGDLRRTLIIGTGIPIAIMVSLVLMATAGLTLNIMTLGGLALGVGMLVDNTIVMLENIYRHQRLGKSAVQAPIDASAEVNSAIIASTSTNLAAVLPFLFIGGLIGLLFRELIATISAAMVASLVVALTVVPALGARVPVSTPGAWRRGVDAATHFAEDSYVKLVSASLKVSWLVPLPFLVALYFSISAFDTEKQVFLPEMDDGRVSARIVADAGISLDQMDRTVAKLETLFLKQPEVVTAFAQVGGFVFGRTQYESSNRARIYMQLVPSEQRDVSSADWAARMDREIKAMRLPGLQVRMRNHGIRGLRVSRGDDHLTIRVQGPDLDTLSRIGESIVERLSAVEGLRNVHHSYEGLVQELSIVVDRERAAALGLDMQSVGRAVRIALQGLVATDFIDEDRQYDVRVRLPRTDLKSPRDVETILLFPGGDERSPVYLGDVARVELINSQLNILRGRQQRMVEVNGTIAGTLGEVTTSVEDTLQDLALPPGYTMFDLGAARTLEHGTQVVRHLIALALFLVLVVMAIQYESLRNPMVILLSVPFAAVGVAIGVWWLQLPLSMPVWLGMIMLAGIVVNNAIVLVEYIEIERGRGRGMREAILEAGRLRLRPILMTTLTTVVGMLPLAVGYAEGSELLRPLAVTIVFGLGFSMLVSLVLIPSMYLLIGRPDPLPVMPPPQTVAG